MSKKIEAKIIADSLSPHMKILNNGMYLLLIDEEVEIKEGDLKICLNDNYISKYLSKQNIESDTKCSDCKKIIAYYPLTKESKELESLPLLPNPFEEVDIEKLAFKELFPHWDSRDVVEHTELAMIKSYIIGYKAAQSKQFSLEDIKTIIKWLNKNYSLVEDELFEPYEGREDEVPDNFFYNAYEEALNRGIQLLSTQQLPKEFILGIGDTIEEQIKNGYYEY